MNRWIWMVLIAVLFGTVLVGHSQQLEPHLEIELTKAVASGLVHCTAVAGEDLTYVVVYLENPSTKTLRIFILPGTVFAPSDSRYQQMGVIEMVVVVLSPYEKKSVLVPTACLDKDLKAPEKGMDMKLAPERSPGLITRVANSHTFQKASFRVRQFAIWTVLSRPASLDEYPGLGLGQEFVESLEALGLPVEILAYLYIAPEVVYALSKEDIEVLAFVFTLAGIPVESADDLYRLFSTGGPTKGELAQVRQIVEEAGLPIEDYPIFSGW